MTSIPVRPYPFERTYDSFEAAIAGAERHPLQPKARSDTRWLLGASIAEAFWTDAEFVLGFSNGRWLHVFLHRSRVRWGVTETEPRLGDPVQRIGSPPVVLDWGGDLGEVPEDRSSLAAARRGAEFTRLWFIDSLLVYTRGMPILWFSPIQRTDGGGDMLFVCEED